ncbi:CAP domain-containing protein [Aquihabitans daechungensis]|uniref:CAP domain-containing protein n=1 Tax=Aquihabitans daechungensis TaxID=1052257 RepID=UPI003B9F2C23
MTAAGVLFAISVLSGCLNPRQESVRAAMTHHRHAHNLQQLRVQADAQRKAQAWAERLAQDGYLHHSNLPSGIHVRWCSLGENVAGPSVNAIEQAYMASPGHRANILATRWNGVGVGYATRGQTIYTVQVFIKTC